MQAASSFWDGRIAAVSRRPPSLFKGPRTRAANGRGTRRVARRGTRWGLDVARTNRHDGTEQAGTCLQLICTVEHRHEVCIYNAPLDACYGGYSSIIRIGLPLARETASPSSSTTLANTRSSSSGPRPPSSLAPRWKPTMLALNWSTWSRKLRT